MKKVVNVVELLQSAKRFANGWTETVVTLAEGETLVHDQLRIKGPGKVWVGKSPSGVIKCGSIGERTFETPNQESDESIDSIMRNEAKEEN